MLNVSLYLSTTHVVRHVVHNGCYGYQADYFRKAVVMMTQLTHLDISDGVRGLYSDDLSTMLHYLTKLKALDISSEPVNLFFSTPLVCYEMS